MLLFKIFQVETINHFPTKKSVYSTSATSFQESLLPIPASFHFGRWLKYGLRALSEMLMQQSTGHIVNRTLDIGFKVILLRKTQ